MTLDQGRQKVIEAVEGVGGRFAIISLLSIIAGTSAWMLKTEIDQAAQQQVLVERLANMQLQVVSRDAQTSADLSDMHKSLDRINASIGSLEVRMGQLSQQLQDSLPGH